MKTHFTRKIDNNNLYEILALCFSELENISHKLTYNSYHKWNQTIQQQIDSLDYFFKMEDEPLKVP